MAGMGADFVATRPANDFELPAIIFPRGSSAAEAFDYDKLSETTQIQNRYLQENPSLEAVRYLREAIERMTGKALPVIDTPDKSKGIVFLKLADAPPDIQQDPAVVKALSNTGEDLYNHNEAFFIRTEPERILIVVNEEKGFNHAAVELLESVGYEVLGVGPNWIHVPDYHDKPLVFSLQADGRPGFYIRQLGLTSGQGHGQGTLFKTPPPDPRDETVSVSFNRWSIGTRIVGNSMPFFVGHAMQKYHRRILEKMEELGTSDGFRHRPGSRVFDNKEVAKIMVDEDGTVHSVRVDFSVPFVRDIILEAFKEESEAYFAEPKNTAIDRLFIFGTDPEDGDQPVEFTRHPDWYPEYLRAAGEEFGRPYVLHGFKGLSQPSETWDPKSFSDAAFGFNNWLLREYDQWIDSLPPEQQLTADGLPKKESVRMSLYSYNNHDVPPNFNLDPRIRVSIAGFPKNRGAGKWRAFRSQIDMAKAFQVMLPMEPSGNYLIPSLSYYRDFETRGIGGSRLPAFIHKGISEQYAAGIRSVHMECDLNFGKMGLDYYFYAKMLWNPHLSTGDLEALRERWLQRAYGSGWEEMKSYYDFMAPENYSVNAPNTWAKAIRFIDAADHKIDPVKEPDAKRRIDDLKQYWYYYYLRESDQAKADSPALREFVWKGQMSYMTPMHMVTKRHFNTTKASEIAGETLASGPAHYTAAETASWWRDMLDFWKWTPVAEFAGTDLPGGFRGRDVDLNDVVAVQELQAGKHAVPFVYNSSSQKNISYLTVALSPGDLVGFRLSWPHDADNIHMRQKDLFYGIERWQPEEHHWNELADQSMDFTASRLVQGKDGKEYQLAEVRFPAPEAGTYRVSLGYAGSLSRLAPLSHDFEEPAPPSGEAEEAAGFTFFEHHHGVDQGGRSAFLYIPKGIRSLDLEVYESKNATVTLHKGLPASGLSKTRTVDINRIGTHTIPLEPGEDGSIVSYHGSGFRIPIFYSIPGFWAMSPTALLVPRQIAEADGLTIISESR